MPQNSIISEQIAHVSNVPCLLLSGRSLVRIQFGVPEQRCKPIGMVCSFFVVFSPTALTPIFNQIFTLVGLSALRGQKECLLNAVGAQRGDAAVMALAESYRRFAADHAELCRFILQMPSGNDTVLKEAAAMTAELFMRVLGDYHLTEGQKMHWQRVLRGLMHGFVSEEQAEYFSHYPVSVDESYQIAVRCLIDGLHREEGESNVQ